MSTTCQGIVFVFFNFAKYRKHGGRGRNVRKYKKWIFGIVEQGSGLSILKVVPNRKATTLLPLIAKYVRPGSTIMTDSFPSYNGIVQLPHGFDHFTVNHNINFINPQTGAHTQNVESKWADWKLWVRRRKGIMDQKLTLQLLEFNWRERYGRRNTFFNFWSQVAAIYMCEP